MYELATCGSGTTTIQPSASTEDGSSKNVSGPPHIVKLQLSLDPSKKTEREEIVIKAKEKYDSEFGILDMAEAYANLFEILWYSQLPCFDVQNITSENQDEMSLIKRCYWKGIKMSCSSIFITRPTDRGMCCTFNMAKAEDIFRKSNYASALSTMQKQDLRYGFEDETLPDWFGEQNEPKTQPGQNKGLRLILDAHTDRISPGTVSDNYRGFVTVIDGGEKYPLTAKNGFLIRPGKENYVALSALRIEADKKIEKINPKKRQCYFPNEYTLEMHNTYSKSNCILECNINYARKMLKKPEEEFGCAPWFYPANDEQYSKVCDPWETKEFQVHMTNVPDHECTRCLPDCAETIYKSRISAAPFRGCDHTNLGTSPLCDLENADMNPPIWTQMVQEEFKGGNIDVPDYAKPNTTKLSNIRKSIIDPGMVKDLTFLHYYKNHKTYNAFEKDIAIVNFYFDQLSVVQFRRSLRMTMIDFVSQMGGLLGLGLGFSFVSAMEIVYWITIRLCRNIMDSNKLQSKRFQSMKKFS